MSAVRTPTKLVVKKVANAIPFEKVSFKLRGCETFSKVKPLILKISAKGRARSARAAETQRRREAAQETKQHEKDNPQ